MLATCFRCSGFVPEGAAVCPHCACDVTVSEAGSAPVPVGRGVRLLRRALRGSLIAGSSMVLAACYGCPPDECGGDDGLGGSGGTPAATGGFGTGGGASGGGPSGGGPAAGGNSPLGGGAGEGGLGGLGGLGGQDAAP